MKKLLASALVGLMAVSVVWASSPASAAGARCDEGHWPATVQGRPASFTSGGRAGYYVWHDSRGWHLRTTTPQSSPHAFSGVITSSDDIRAVHVYRNEARDKVAVSGNTLRFSFRTWDHVDGIDFVVGCTETVKFALAAEGHRWPASRIWLGRTGTAPSNPFTVSRVA
jgi:hypothetical protein